MAKLFWGIFSTLELCSVSLSALCPDEGLEHHCPCSPVIVLAVLTELITAELQY